MELDSFFEKAVAAAEHYSLSTGINCAVIDLEGAIVGGSRSPGQGQEFCRQLEKIFPGNELNCNQVHRYGSYQAERFGGKYMFFCPMSLLHWTSPLYRDGSVVGSLICGPALIIDSEDFIRNDLISGKNLPASEVFRLMKLAADIPSVTTERSRSLSELLFVTASGISELDRIEFQIHQENSEQQKEISEYIQYIKQMENSEAEISRYPFEKETDLIDHIENGETNHARAVLNEILGNVFFAAGGDLKVVRARVLELVVLLSRAAVRGGADAEQIFGMNYQYINRINSFTSVEAIASWLSRIIVKFSELVFDMREIKHADAIQGAMQFVRENFQNKISLDEAAAYVNLSPSYLSKLFKKELDQNFNAYLNQVRVEKSKNYLLNTEIPLVDIAGMCGFEDQSYFSKVFKKFTGNSPGKFRETRGRRESDTHEIHSEN
ncbi:MAG: helix-turn-helix domain-containing protein [Spirochaetales bacterium]|uniref:Helix-turn-helix domain-containing protein n=1 Tax=Candidatus Thalassospirochaeta sargassi TaxID=3119039 RepID=A0AAJ1MNN9_9SPIO|nr:helix-turn-helix domain-containing protein [Spirochaetales bacterium]